MNSPLTSVLAETASSVLPPGDVAAAIEIVSFTVIEVEVDSTDMAMGISRVAPATIFPPERVARAKPGAETKIEYVPAGRSAIPNLPLTSAAVVRDAAVDSF